ncbi:nitrate- and nitrite sensing domain-containing protein [Helicobacter sp. 23-1044]
MLNNLNIKSKIVILVALPLVAMAILMAILLLRNYDALKNDRQLQTQIAISTKLSALVHELQKERGLSAGFISSKGASFGGELRSQRQLTDKAFADFSASVDGANLSAQHKNLLNDGFSALKSLNATRKSADSTLDSANAPLQSIISYYTSTIASLLHTIVESTKLVNESATTLQMISYMNFFVWQRKCGIRARNGQCDFCGKCPRECGAI